jgi:hypothetical protein
LQQFVDAKLYDLLGERTAADDEKPTKKKKEKPAKVEVETFAGIFFFFPIFLLPFKMPLIIFSPLYTYVG